MGWFFIFILGIIIIWKVNDSYEKKVKDILEEFRKSVNKFQHIAEGRFEVKTNHKKVRRWDKQHAIDYIINENAKELIVGLQTYNELKVWWYENANNVKKQIEWNIDYNARNMFLLGSLFRRRATRDFNDLFEKYNPEKLTFRLCTYSFYEEGEGHYDPYSKSYITSASRYKNFTFCEDIAPDDLSERIEILAQYNFSITQYQYNCENQRALMTKELRRQIIIRDNKICQICGKKCSDFNIEIDHIKPVSKGGKTIPSNLQVLCTKCNRQKSNKWLGEIGSRLSVEATDPDNVIMNKIAKVDSNKVKKEITKTVHDVVKETIPIESSTKKNIKWIHMSDSSSIIRVYFNHNINTLYVNFKNNTYYAYYEVEKEIFNEFLMAPSKGLFVRNNLKNYKYKYIQVSDIV